MKSFFRNMTSGWMVIAGACFSAMGVFIKLAAKDFSVPEMAFYRGLFSLAFVGSIIVVRGYSLRTKHWKPHCVRGAVGFLSFLGYFYSISKMPLATAMTLSYTSPIFLAVFTVLLLKERFPRALLIAIALGFAGSFLVFRPSLSNSQLLPPFFAIFAACFGALAYLNIRKLGRLGEPDWRIVFYFSLIAAIGGFVCQLVTSHFHPLTKDNLLLLFGVGFFATTGQLTMTRAFSRGNALVVGALSYSTVLFSCAAGWLVWHDTIEIVSWIGITFIISSGILANWIEIKSREKIMKTAI